MIVYHPQAWAFNWPKGAKPYASEELAVADGHHPDTLMSSPYSGAVEDVVTKLPAKDALGMASEPTPEEIEAEEQARAQPPPAPTEPVVPQAPASPTPSKKKKSK